MNTEPSRLPTHTLAAENGLVSVSRDGVVIYTFKADLVEEMSIEPRKFNGAPCYLLAFKGAGPVGVLFSTHQLANDAMDVVINARRRTMRVFDFNACDKHIRKNSSLFPPCVYEANDYDVELLALGANVGEKVVLVYGDAS